MEGEGKPEEAPSLSAMLELDPTLMDIRIKADHLVNLPPEDFRTAMRILGESEVPQETIGLLESLHTVVEMMRKELAEVTIDVAS